MTSMIHPRADRARRYRKTLFALLLGGAAGFAAAFGFTELSDTGTLGRLQAVHEIAVLVGLVYLATAGGVVFGVLAPRAGATFLNVEDADELREQGPMLAVSGVGLAAMGAALVIVALAAPVGPIGQPVALAAFAGLCAVTVVCSVRANARQDELMKTMSTEMAGWSFYLVLIVGGTWAMLAHLQYAPIPGALAWLTMLWALLLVAAFIVIARRGMMVMR